VRSAFFWSSKRNKEQGLNKDIRLKIRGNPEHNTYGLWCVKVARIP
jgi:hypothetical protein